VHAEASEAQLELSMESGSVRLRITDDGVGYDPRTEKTGLGLASIRERARLLDGSVRFVSEPGKGTEVSVEIPLGAKAS
jgi:signal transduction histidine kinase